MSHKIASLINPSEEEINSSHSTSSSTSSTPQSSNKPLLPTYPSVSSQYNSSFPSDILLEIRSNPRNNFCSDCYRSSPEWASVSLGVLLCLSCAGKHRGLGVRISFVRSLLMDSWTGVQIEAIRQGGNEQFNEFVEKVYNIKSINKLNSKEYLDFFSSCSMDDYRLKLKTRSEIVINNYDKNKILPYELVPYNRGGRKLFSNQEIDEMIYSQINFNNNCLSYGDDTNELIKSTSMKMISSSSVSSVSSSVSSRSSSPLSSLDYISSIPQNINSKLSETYNILFPSGTMGMILTKSHGGQVTSVSKIIEGSVASQYGVQVGDIIAKIESQTLRSSCGGDFESVMKMIQFAPRPLYIEFRRNPNNLEGNSSTLSISSSSSTSSSSAPSPTISSSSNSDNKSSNSDTYSSSFTTNNVPSSSLVIENSSTILEQSETSRESDDSDNNNSNKSSKSLNKKKLSLETTPIPLTIRGALSPTNSISNLTTQLKNSQSNESLNHSISNHSLSHSLSNNSLSRSPSVSSNSLSLDFNQDELFLEESFNKTLKIIENNKINSPFSTFSSSSLSNLASNDDNYNHIVDIFDDDESLRNFDKNEIFNTVEKSNNLKHIDYFSDPPDLTNFTYSSPVSKSKPPIYPQSGPASSSSTSSDIIAIPNSSSSLILEEESIKSDQNQTKIYLEPGTPIKVLRLEDNKWKSAYIIRMHRDNTFKIVYRNGINESHVSPDRIAFSIKMLEEKGIINNREDKLYNIKLLNNEINSKDSTEYCALNSSFLSSSPIASNPSSFLNLSPSRLPYTTAPFSPQGSHSSSSSCSSSPSVLFSSLMDQDLFKDFPSNNLSSSLSSSINEKELINFIDETLDENLNLNPLTLSSLLKYECKCDNYPFYCPNCSNSYIFSIVFTSSPLGLTLVEGEKGESIVLSLKEDGQAKLKGVQNNDILISITSDNSLPSSPSLSFFTNKVCLSYDISMEKFSSLSYPITLSFLRKIN